MYMYLHLQILLPQLATFPARTALKLIVTAKPEVSESRGQPRIGDTYQRSESDSRSGVKVFLRARERQWVSGYSEIRHKKLEYKEWAPKESGLSSGG